MSIVKEYIDSIMELGDGSYLYITEESTMGEILLWVLL